MHFLSDEEQQDWRSCADEILRTGPAPGRYDAAIRQELVPAFHFYIATFLAAHGSGDEALAWAQSAVPEECEDLYGLGFLTGFLERYDKKLKKPALVFRDPGPFIHFTNVPVMKGARERFVHHCGGSLPVFSHPVRFMDIGCGNGELCVRVLSHLLEKKKIPAIGEVLLIDPSPAMAALAEKTVREAFPYVPVRIEICRIQDCSGTIDQKIDIAMSSLAYHHMPVEDKRIHLARLRPWIDHFLLFEMDADIDTPDLYSPALALAVYQSYGRIFDSICAHDTAIELANNCIDAFLMTEVISILTEPRGVRSDYHMQKNQWTALFSEVLGPGFSCRCNEACYSHDYMSMFTLHYARNGHAGRIQGLPE